MESPFHPLSLRNAARIAGALYLFIIVLGVFAQMYALEPLVVARDAAATAANLLEHELRYRLGFAAHLFYLACAVTVALILYRLLQPAGRNLALLAVLFNIVAIAVEAAVLLNLLAALRFLGMIGPEGLDAPAAQALAYTFTGLFSNGFGMSLVFFGFFCILTGILIFRSGFLPRIIGILMQVAGACYLVNSFTLFVVPAVAAKLYPFILLPCLVAELSLTLWLLIRGVDEAAWAKKRAGYA